MILSRRFINSISIIAGCFVAAMSCSAARAATLFVEYSDSSELVRGASFSGLPAFPWEDSNNFLSLPMFDPGLGTLLSVQLSATTEVYGGASAHCSSPGYCWSSIHAVVSNLLGFENMGFQLGVDLGDDLVAYVEFSARCDDGGLKASCAVGPAYDSRIADKYVYLTGENVAPFGGDDNMYLYETGVRLGGAHDGSPNETLLELYGAADEHFTPIYLADLFLKMRSSDPEHAGIIYNHAHVIGMSMTSVNVRYEYEPFAAVPEPSTWAMMIAGFGLIGGAMRRMARATSAA